MIDNKQLNIAICGATGRMGKAVIETLEDQYSHYNISGQIDSTTTDSDLAGIISRSDIIIDFSLPVATDKILASAVKYKVPIVICTTGLDSSQLDNIEKAGKDIAVLYAPNTSLGANLLGGISAKIAEILKDYDVEIVDTHHRYKKDSPSGTAIAIGKSVAQARGDNYDDVARIGRSGSEMRRSSEIGISSLRSGGVFGCHDVSFANDHEVITMSHQALSRNVFAEGAIKAAIWLAEKPRGFYHIEDMLNL